ncbi:MAG TPA: transposase [Gammaproteobacteria bacterium]
MRKPHGNHLRKGRHSEAGRTYLVTTATARRLRYFDDLYLGRLVVKAMHHAHAAGDVSSLCFVVMPDHLHWLFELGERRTLSEVMNRFKTWTAHEINRTLGERGQVWQQGFHDHALRAQEDLRSIARYVVANPLRAGIVTEIGMYPLWDAVWLEGGEVL